MLTVPLKLSLLTQLVASFVRREIELSKMLHVVGEYLSDMNAGSKKPHNLVLFQFALEHVARISAVVSQPGGQNKHGCRSSISHDTCTLHMYHQSDAAHCCWLIHPLAQAVGSEKDCMTSLLP
jgi:hypothetical protein